MRKIKKINGFLVVRFNDRELREWAGTALGKYGIIDAKLYTGNLGIDKGALEFDGIDNLEEAIDQARGLVYPPEPEHIKTGLPAPKTIPITMPDDLIAAAPFEPDPLDNVLAEAWRKLSRNIEEAVRAACDALHKEDREPDTFVNLPPERQGCLTRQVYALGRVLEDNCPMNDCKLYLNIFNQCREIDEQIDRLEGWPQQLLEMELDKNYLRLENMFRLNYAVRQYRKTREPLL